MTNGPAFPILEKKLSFNTIVSKRYAVYVKPEVLLANVFILLLDSKSESHGSQRSFECTGVTERITIESGRRNPCHL